MEIFVLFHLLRIISVYVCLMSIVYVYYCMHMSYRYGLKIMRVVAIGIGMEMLLNHSQNFCFSA